MSPPTMLTLAAHDFQRSLDRLTGERADVVEHLYAFAATLGGFVGQMSYPYAAVEIARIACALTLAEAAEIASGRNVWAWVQRVRADRGD